MLLRKASNLLFLFLVGCGISGPTETKKEAQTIDYYKDERTGLCFARSAVENSNGFGHNIFSYVPCTPEVEKLLVK